MKSIVKVSSILFFSLSNIFAESVLDKYGDRIELLGIPFKDPLVLCQILTAIFLSIAFIQSGIDKIMDREGNLEFLKVHFSNSFLKKIISPLLSILTILELLGGAMLVYGIYYAFAMRTTLWIFYGFVLFLRLLRSLTTTGLATESMATPAASTYASSPVGGSGAMPASCNFRSKRARL